MLGALRIGWLINLLPRTINYFFSSQVPFFFKLTLLIPVFWYFTPVARVANAFPILGLLDEFTIILLTMALFTYMVGRYLRRKNPPRDAPPLEIIEGDYYVMDARSEKKKVNQ